jgi:hypothetical protein
VNCSDAFSKSIRPRLVGGLVSHSHRIERIGSLIRFATEAEMASLRNVLGSLSSCGKRQRRAKLGTTRCLKENDDLNVISTSTEADGRRRTDQEGIDFVFNTAELVLAVHFRHHRHQFATTNAPDAPVPPSHLNEVLNLARVDDDDETEEDNAITQGSLFEWDPGPRLFKVVQIGDDGLVSCLCLGPRGVMRGTDFETDDLRAVSLAIRACNSEQSLAQSANVMP